MHKILLILLVLACLALAGHGRRISWLERLRSRKWRLNSGSIVENQDPIRTIDTIPVSQSFSGEDQPEREIDAGEVHDGDADSSSEVGRSEAEGGESDGGESEPDPEPKISRMIIIEHLQEPEMKPSRPQLAQPGASAKQGAGGSAKESAGEDGKPKECQCQPCCLMRRLQQAELPMEAKEVANRELQRLRRMPPTHPEHSTIIEYLEWIADLPWAKASEDRLTISAAREQLTADHFGMERVKGRILEYLSVCKLKGTVSGNIICLHGPPGIGKTSLGRSVADALQRDFYRVSLGGVHSEAEVRGHRRAYVGAMPGLILHALKKCGTHNCVIMLDEIDKLGRHSLNGDPSAALLEVLDPEQNHAFRDHFLNLPFDLSRVLFIATANELEPIPRALLDRMEVIEMSGYTVEEKIQIARRHLLPKQRKNHGLGDSDIEMEEPAMDALISGYTREAGVRELDRQLAALCRSIAARTAEAAEAEAHTRAIETSSSEANDENEDVEHEYTETEDPTGEEAINVDSSGSDLVDNDHGNHSSGSDTADSGIPSPRSTLHAEDLIDILGPPKYDGPRDNADRQWKAGIATGLAWTAVGGDVLMVEAETMTGRGELTITGTLGDVMVESVKIATGWVRAHSKELGIPEGAVGSSGLLLNGTDLHIHFPAGATPKDGPSAGVTIATAIVSLLTGRLVRPDLAMTGEITLRGLVLPVGGIKEKLIAAHRAGMKHVLIPAKNEKDLRDLPASVLNEMSVGLMKDIEDVLSEALLPQGESVPSEKATEDVLEVVD